VSIDLAVTSRPVDTVAAWVSAGWKAGIGLGSVYGVVIGWLGSPILSLPGLGAGCVLGFVVGVAAGALNGLLLGLGLTPFFPSEALAALIAISVPTAAAVALRLPPAGRAADPEARVRIQAW
jgi:hypothetical protein